VFKKLSYKNIILLGDCTVFKSTEVAFSNAQTRQNKVESSYTMGIELDSFVVGTESCHPALRHFNSSFNNQLSTLYYGKSL